MRVKIKEFDLVTYKDEKRRVYAGEKVYGYIQYLHKGVTELPIRWIAPKQYKNTHSVVPMEDLVVVLKKKDPRAQKASNNA